MRNPLLVLGSPGSPRIDVFANEAYSLYHWLVRQGESPSSHVSTDIQDASRRAAAARHLQGVHGVWDAWEEPLASVETVDEAVTGLKSSMEETVNTLASALYDARSYFHEQVWPSHMVTIEAAAATIGDTMQPHFPALIRRQAELLSLRWPDSIAAYFVADCYAWQGGYSHPLTIDVSANTGTTLCETLIHEATHVAEVSGNDHPDMGSRLRQHLTSEGLSPQDAWNAWHAVIFASSAGQVRRFIDPRHVDYASNRGLYSWLKVPHLPEMWRRYTSGTIAERELIESIASEVSGP